ncbi:MAG: SMEK domain-containing protein [Ferruginibacter sp.]
MKQVHLISKISSLLTQFSLEIRDKGKLKLHDINLISEDILVPILSILYDTDLRNLNDEKANYPGIDLASDEHITLGGVRKKIAFQITSTKNIDKVLETLTTYTSHNFYKHFDCIYIYNLTEKQSRYNKSSVEKIKKIIQNKFVFDLNKNILDKSDLLKKVKSLTPLSKIDSILRLLEDQLVYKKKSLLSLEIWESDGKIGYGFSNLIDSINVTTYQTLLSNNTVSSETKEVLEFLLTKYNKAFSINYENQKLDKFKNLGFNTYLKAGFTQALNSFLVVKSKIVNNLNTSDFSQRLFECLSKLSSNLKESDFPLIENPINHPAIGLIKETIQSVFSTLGIDKEIWESFLKSFNENISITVIETFGKLNYQKHLENTKDKWLKENEKDFLFYLKDLAKLGFAEGEQLEYQESFGIWEDIRQYGSLEEDSLINENNAAKKTAEKKIESDTDSLKPISNLITEYFDYYKNEKEGYLNNILFLIADFGKGKTSFLHHFASELAEQYLKTHEGFFPVYLNLNQYDIYSNSPSLGVIANFLAKGFKIDIKEEYFKKKNYFFLIDSLDECGELTESNIEKVIKDINEIQNLDIINQRKNRIIIASRPLAKGLKEQISKYKPYPIKLRDNDSEIDEIVDNYISVHGFKSEQFDKYIEFALKKFISNSKKNQDDFSGIARTLISNILKGEKINIHSKLNKTILNESELKRPIFAYMIYKLIVSNSNFMDLGKVGIYISFINQLSRDAKHKDDTNHKISLEEEFVYRNILHSSALLWQYKRQSGEQTSLTKGDICRTIEEKEIDKDDRKVLTEFKEVESIHFLSHSYFGEKENTLHFQHQSFAEILLAEYYLKIIIKCAIEENTDVEEARIRLSIGLPTDQTVDFFKGLLELLKECVLSDPKEKSIHSKRELLIPLLSSLAIKKHNKKLYSTRLNATWFEKHEKEIFSKNKISNEIVDDFPITMLILAKIEVLCREIISSKKIYFLDEPARSSVLFKNELTIINNYPKIYEIDKWLALITGNIVGTNVMKRQFFNSNLNTQDLFNIITHWNYYVGEIPYWGIDLFMGINMKNDEGIYNYKRLDLSRLNFSYSNFKNVSIQNSTIRFCDFSNSTFEYFNIIRSDITGSKFENITIMSSQNETLMEGNFSLTFCFIAQGVTFPQKLNTVLKGTSSGISNFSSDSSTIIGPYEHENQEHSFFVQYLLPLAGIFRYILSKGYKANFILSTFKFEDYDITPFHKKYEKYVNTKEKFKMLINNIEKGITKTKEN